MIRFPHSEIFLSVCTALATLLDLEMLQLRASAVIYSEKTPDAAMPLRPGTEVAAELGGRCVLRYLLHKDVLRSSGATTPVLGSRLMRAYVTPTPYSPSEVIHALALPFSSEWRSHVILLRPEFIPWMQGPRRVENGSGLEYILPNGYPASALAFKFERTVT